MASLRSGEVWRESLLLVDGPLHSRRAHGRRRDTDASTGQGGEFRGGADQNVHRLHWRDEAQVDNQHCPLQILIHHNVAWQTDGGSTEVYLNRTDRSENTDNNKKK